MDIKMSKDFKLVLKDFTIWFQTTFKGLTNVKGFQTSFKGLTNVKGFRIGFNG